MNKEQYKTYLRQRLNEEHSDNHDYIKPHDIQHRNVSTGEHTEFKGTPHMMV